MIKSISIDLYKKFLGYLIKKGKKKKSQNTLNKSLFIISKKHRIKPYLVFLKLFLQLNTFIEARTIKRRQRSLTVPFFIKSNRQIHMVLKWIVSSLILACNRIPTTKKITLSILSILKNNKSKALELKASNSNLALINRSNMHFRW